ncbi:hypothetical protein MTR67_044549 [Solanum verrucosum]|uniref:Secreted protein n=1 Tax=Solanum verrucosum TaxID=315347 RepID=A0AAF0UTN0_SOLVR|nr:hypothetical protein MTR67_044549 [Solanum verrucosum]
MHGGSPQTRSAQAGSTRHWMLILVTCVCIIRRCSPTDISTLNVRTRMQILRSCRCNLRSPSMDRRSDHGPCWWSVVHHCNPSPNQLRKLAKPRLTDRPTVRRLDHGPWSVSVDRDFPYQPLTQTMVDQNGPSFDPRFVGLTVDKGQQPVS